MRRNEFIIKSGLASLAIASSTSIFGNLNPFKNAHDTVNIGLIGTGSRGSGLIPYINEIDNLNVAACCDILPFRLNEAIKRTESNPKAYSDYRQLLDNQDIDAVLIATPFNTHAAIAMDAIDAQKHVYCEKTMAMGYVGIENVVEKVASSKKIFQTGHQYHSSRLYTYIVNLIKKGKIGKIIAFECQWNRNGDWRRPVPSPELEKIINWRMYKAFSGGLVAELCSHQIDFVNWVMQATPLKVIGLGGIDYWKDGRETYDNVHLVYSYPQGVKATFTCLTSNAMNGYQIKVLGDRGTIILDYAHAWFYPEGDYKKEIQDVDGVSGATIKWDQGKGVPINVEHTNSSKQALIDFKSSIIDNKPPASNATTGANVAVAVQMGLEAMYEDKVVQWKS